MNYSSYLAPQRSLLGATGPGYDAMVMPAPAAGGQPDTSFTSSLYRDPRAVKAQEDLLGRRNSLMDRLRNRRVGNTRSYFNPMNYQMPGMQTKGPMSFANGSFFNYLQGGQGNVSGYVAPGFGDMGRPQPIMPGYSQRPAYPYNPSIGYVQPQF